MLDVADLGSLESYCIAQGRVQEIQRLLTAAGGFDIALDRAQQKAIQTARQLAAQFGLTPADRSRPTVREGADDDEAADLFGE